MLRALRRETWIELGYLLLGGLTSWIAPGEQHARFATLTRPFALLARLARPIDFAAVDDKPVTDARDLARKIGGMAPGTTVKLVVMRSGAEKTFNLTLGELPNVREARAESDTSGLHQHVLV